MDIDRLTWGIEIEGAMMGQLFPRNEISRGIQNHYGWTVHRDGSVGKRFLDNSFEIVSPVMRVDDFPGNIYVLSGVVQYAVDRGIRSVGNAGVHIHIGRLHSEERLTLCYAWALMESRILEHFLPRPKRRPYVLPWSENFRQLILHRLPSTWGEVLYAWYGIHQGESPPAPPDLWVREYRRRAGERYDVARYHALNLSAWNIHETLEWRMFNGTMDGSMLVRYIAWLFSWLALIPSNLIERISPEDNDSIEKLWQNSLSQGEEAWHVAMSVLSDQVSEPFRERG